MQIAADAMNNHQTVRAFCMEEKFLDSYSKKLHSAYKYVRTVAGSTACMVKGLYGEGYVVVLYGEGYVVVLYAW